MVIVCSEFDRSLSRQNYDHHRANSRHSQNGFATRDDDDDDEAVSLPVKDHDEMPGRSESPVLRPLPSMSYISLSLVFSCFQQLPLPLPLPFPSVLMPSINCSPVHNPDITIS